MGAHITRAPDLLMYAKTKGTGTVLYCRITHQKTPLPLQHCTLLYTLYFGSTSTSKSKDKDTGKGKGKGKCTDKDINCTNWHKPHKIGNDLTLALV
jgi:hypothetical protein